MGLAAEDAAAALEEAGLTREQLHEAWRSVLAVVAVGNRLMVDTLSAALQQLAGRLAVLENQNDAAEVAFKKAIELDPNNAMIRQNYDLFKEINDRTNRRTGK